MPLYFSPNSQRCLYWLQREVTCWSLHLDSQLKNKHWSFSGVLKSRVSVYLNAMKITVTCYLISSQTVSQPDACEVLFWKSSQEVVLIYSGLTPTFGGASFLSCKLSRSCKFVLAWVHQIPLCHLLFSFLFHRQWCDSELSVCFHAGEDYVEYSPANNLTLQTQGRKLICFYFFILSFSSSLLYLQHYTNETALKWTFITLDLILYQHNADQLTNERTNRSVSECVWMVRTVVVWVCTVCSVCF